MTLALPIAFGDGQSDSSKERAYGREQHLRVTQHAQTRAGELAGRLRDRHSGERKQPGPAERPRSTERRSKRGGHTECDERERHEGRRH